MTKADLVARIASEASITKKVASLTLDAFVAAVHNSLKKDGEIRISDLGTFKVTKRKARTGVNPQTKKKMKIPATKAPTFRAAQALKEAAKKAN